MVRLKGIWSEEARPTNLSEIILPKRLEKTFRSIIEKRDMSNLLLVSPTPGTGKTSIAQILAKELKTSCLYIKGSEEAGIDTLRNKISMYLDQPNVTGFYSGEEKITPFKIIFVDECDGMSHQFQKGLRSAMNDYEKDCRYIFTCNYETNLIEPIIDRFTIIRFEFTKEEIIDMGERFYERVCNILSENNIVFDEEVVAKVIIEHMPRFRRIWDKLYEIYLTYGGEITKQTYNEEKELNGLIDAINTKNYATVMKVISESSTISLTTIFSALFRHMDKLNFRKDILTYTLNDYSLKAERCADKFLNFMAWFSEVCLREKGEF